MNSRYSSAVQQHLDHFEQLYAADSDPWRLQTTWSEHHKRRIIGRALGPQRHDRGLELGCGSGITTRHLAKHFHQLLAVDGSPSAVERARSEVAGLSHVAVVEAALPLSLPRTAFNAVIASEILYYLPGAALSQMLAEIHGALRRGGSLIMANHVLRFSDSERALAQLLTASRSLFGGERWSYAWGPWRVTVFVKKYRVPSVRASTLRIA